MVGASTAAARAIAPVARPQGTPCLLQALAAAVAWAVVDVQQIVDRRLHGNSPRWICAAGVKVTALLVTAGVAAAAAAAASAQQRST